MKKISTLFFLLILVSVQAQKKDFNQKLKEHDVLKLDGNIEFFRNQLPFNASNEFDISVLTKPQKLNFPLALWSKGGLNKNPAKGYGTIVFHFELPDVYHQYYLDIERITGGCEIWINNQYHSEFGVFSKDIQQSSSRGTPLVLKLPKKKKNTVAFLISNNQHHWGGGINRKPKLLVEEAMLKHTKEESISDYIAFVFLLFLMLYQWYLYALHKERKYIYMAFICIGFILRTIVVKQSIMYDFIPSIPFSIVQILRYISIHVVCISVLLFYREFIPKQINKKTFLFFITVHSVGIVVCLLLNTYRVTQWAAFMRLFIVAQIVFCFWFLGLAVYKKEKHAKLLLISVFVVLLCLVNNVLHASYIIQTFFIGSYLSLIYLLVQTVVNHYVQRNVQQQMLSLSRELGDQKNKVLSLELETVTRIEEKEALTKSLKKIEGKKSEIDKVISGIQANAKEEQRIKTIRESFKDTLGFKERLTQKHPKLTKTDIEIATLIVIGKTRQEIADLRGVEVNTIKTSRNRLRKKLQVPVEVLLDDYLKKYRE